MSETLSLVLRLADVSSNCIFNWDEDRVGTYDGGKAYIGRADGFWQAQDHGMGFRVFFEPQTSPNLVSAVNPTPTPIPSPPSTPLAVRITKVDGKISLPLG